MLLEELRKKRIDCGYTQEELASIVGISRSTLSLLETGKRKPSYDIMTKLAGALNEAIEIR